MDFLSFLRILAKSKWMMLVAVAFGVLFAGISMYEIDFSKKAPYMQLYPRSYTTYSTAVSLMISDPNFSMGRVGYDPVKGFGLGKTIELAPTYAKLAVSEPIIREAVMKLGKIDAEIVPMADKGSPIFSLTVKGKDPQHIKRLATTVATTFIEYIKDNQNKHKVPVYDRVGIQILSQPKEVAAERSRAVEMALIAFLAPIGATVIFILVLDNLKAQLRKEKEEAVMRLGRRSV